MGTCSIFPLQISTKGFVYLFVLYGGLYIDNGVSFSKHRINGGAPNIHYQIVCFIGKLFDGIRFGFDATDQSRVTRLNFRVAKSW